MATQNLRPQRVDRRRFLLSATATVACTGVAPSSKLTLPDPKWSASGLLSALGRTSKPGT